MAASTAQTPKPPDLPAGLTTAGWVVAAVAVGWAAGALLARRSGWWLAAVIIAGWTAVGVLAADHWVGDSSSDPGGRVQTVGWTIVAVVAAVCFTGTALFTRGRVRRRPAVRRGRGGAVKAVRGLTRVRPAERFWQLMSAPAGAVEFTRRTRTTPRDTQ